MACTSSSITACRKQGRWCHMLWQGKHTLSWHPCWCSAAPNMFAIVSLSIVPGTSYARTCLQEVASQQQQQGSSAPLMNKDMLDLIFVNRLIESPPEQYPQPPFQYLLGCFARAVNELRSVSPRHAPEVQQHLQGVIVACKELLVSYAALILTASGVVPEVSTRQFSSCALHMHVGFLGMRTLVPCLWSECNVCKPCIH